MKVATGDVVVLNKSADAYHYVVKSVNGFDVEIQQGTSKPQHIDKDMITGVVRNEKVKYFR